MIRKTVLSRIPLSNRTFHNNKNIVYLCCPTTTLLLTKNKEQVWMEMPGNGESAHIILEFTSEQEGNTGAVRYDTDQ